MARFTYSDAVNAARGAVTDDRVSQLQGYYNSVSSQRPASGTTSAYTPSAPTTTVPTTKTNNNSLSGSSSVKLSTSNTAATTQAGRYSAAGAPATQTPSPASVTPAASTPAAATQLTSRYYFGPNMYVTRSPIETQGEGVSAVTPTTETPETATAETPQSTAYTPTTVRTTTSANNQSTTNTQKSTPATYTPTGMYDPNNLKAYNDQRVADIRSLYEQALQNSLSGMRTAYDQNMSDAQAARDQISPQYQRSMNALSAEYERQRRNNNMQAAANGLNTGAGSQMQLAQSANYQANQAGLAARENEALNEANRRIGDLQRNYQNAIAEATANNNYKLAASLMEEYQNAYNRQMQIENTNYTRAWNEDERNYSRGIDEANRKAQYGDFSGYAALYGDDAARLMEQTWAMQNPYQAWASGKLSAEDFYAITGKLPANPADVADQLAAYGYTGSSSGSSLNGSSNGDYGDFDSLEDLKNYYGKVYIEQLIREGKQLPTMKHGPTRRYKGGMISTDRSNKSIYDRGNSKKSYSRGYSSSRDRAYRGSPGYYDKYGNFVSEDLGIRGSLSPYTLGYALPGVGQPSDESLAAAQAAGYKGESAGKYLEGAGSDKQYRTDTGTVTKR